MATMAQSIRLALHYAEKHLALKDIFGEDVSAPLGGVFTATQGLQTTWNSPLDERGIIGMAMGIALTGQRCVAEIQFCDYIFNTIDLLKLAGGLNWSVQGQSPLPLVIMTPVGSGIHGSIYHSHSFDAWASRLAGWKVVMPSNPKDAYGLLLSAIEDPNPVMYLPPKALFRMSSEEKDLLPGEPEDKKELKDRIDAPVDPSLRKKWKPRWPEMKSYKVPFGKAHKVFDGEQVSVVSYGRSLVDCKQVVQGLSAEGYSIELIDLRSIIPYDWQMIAESIKKTKKVLFVNEDTELTNFGEHLAYRASIELFYDLWAPPKVLAAKHLPGIGIHWNLEQATVPQQKDIREAILDLKNQKP